MSAELQEVAGAPGPNDATPLLPAKYGATTPGPTDGQLIHVLAERSLAAARRASVLKLPDPHAYALVTDDGVEIRELPPEPRDHRLASVAELPPYLADMIARSFSPSVWIAADAVRVVLDDGEDERREERCRVDLRPTPEWKMLKDWRVDGFHGTGKELCKLLRTVLVDTLTEKAKGQIKAISALRGRSEAQTRAVSGLGKESLGRDIDREVVSEAGELPEMLTLNVRPFDDPALEGRFPIRVHLDVDADTLRIEAVASAADLSLAEASQLEGVRSRIEGVEGEAAADVAAFLGRPDGAR